MDASLIASKHEFFCHHGGNPLRFRKWSDFTNTFTDPVQNLVFRWDWCYGTTLRIFMVQQRKGRVICAQIAISERDEPKVRAWLQERLQVLVSVWSPLTVGTGTKTEIASDAQAAGAPRQTRGMIPASPTCQGSNQLAAAMAAE